MNNKAKLIILIYFFLTYANMLSSQCSCESKRECINEIIVSNVEELIQAINKVNSGQSDVCIILKKGEYILTENLPALRIFFNASIIGETGNRDDVVIKGQGFNRNVTHIFNVFTGNNFTISDLTIGWVSQHPIQLHGELGIDHPLIRNVKIVDGNEQFIKVSSDLTKQFTHSVGGIIECCHFEFSQGVGNQYYTGGIDAHYCRDWIVRNNIFSGIRSPDSELAEHAIHFWKNSVDIKIENNIIFNCDRGIGLGLGSDTLNGTEACLIANNFVHTTRDVGIGLENAFFTKVYYNTVWTENYDNSIEYRFSRSDINFISNNLSNKKVQSRDNGQAQLHNNYQQALANYFVDFNNFNFHLSSNAKNAIKRGIDIPSYMTDIDCEIRSSTMVDIGADQVSSLGLNHYPQELNISYQFDKSGIKLNCVVCPDEIEIYNLEGIKLYSTVTFQNQIYFTKEFSPGLVLIKFKYKDKYIVRKNLLIE